MRVSFSPVSRDQAEALRLTLDYRVNCNDFRSVEVASNAIEFHDTSCLSDLLNSVGKWSSIPQWRTASGTWFGETSRQSQAEPVKQQHTGISPNHVPEAIRHCLLAFWVVMKVMVVHILRLPIVLKFSLEPP